MGILNTIVSWFETPPLPERRQLESPVPWITHGVWTQWYGYVKQPWDPKKMSPVVSQGACMVATPADQKRAPIAALLSNASTPTGDLAMHNVALQALRAPAIVLIRPTWPVCCDRLSTLVLAQGLSQDPVSLDILEAETGSLDQAYLEAELRPEWGTQAKTEQVLKAGYREPLKHLRGTTFGHDGVNVFQCGGCGRLYVAACEG